MVMPAKYYQAMKMALPEAESTDCTDLLAEFIAHKSAYDVKMIESTAKIADTAMIAAMNACKEGATEIDAGFAAQRVKFEMGAEEGSGTRVRTHIYVVSAGTVLSNVRPYFFTRKKFRKGEVFFIDLSVCYNGYYTDFCRSVSIGRPNKKQEEIFDVTMETHKKLFSALRPGITGEELYKIGLKVGQEAGYKDKINFVWLGHGSGLIISEPPFFAMGEKRKILPNTFNNIEPGVFVPGTAPTSIKDEIFVPSSGTPRFVTNCPRELHIG